MAAKDSDVMEGAAVARVTQPVRRRRRRARELSPTTSIWNVLITLAIGFALGLTLDARGVMHAAYGMPDGLMRTATLQVGQAAQHLAVAGGIAWPWEDARAALGRSDQPSVPPMLASTSPELRPPPSFNRATSFLLSRWSRIPAAASPPRTGQRFRLRTPTRRNPLRLLVTGDSLSGYLGLELVDLASRAGPVVAFADTHNGTGLTRPDYVDWSVVAQQQVASRKPEAVVVLIGGNDFQNMVMPDRRVLIAGTPAWTQEYARRASICMRIWTRGQATRRVYWLSVPPARDPSWAAIDGRINLALREATKRVPGAEYLDILGPITDHGRYSDFVRSGGRVLLVREQDGVHLNLTGSSLVADQVLTILRREWHLGRRGHR